MRLTSWLFLATLWSARVGDDPITELGTPLSMSRDGRGAIVGYQLSARLLAMGVIFYGD